MNDFMKGMRRQTVRANGVRINAWVGGKGDPVVLLHGYPQTGQMWRKVVPGLLDRFTVVCPDLRGYGDSDKPRDGYDKRSMAKDMHDVMHALGHRRFALVGHDRGARVAHRLAMDYPEAVKNLTVLDIVPTHTLFKNTGKELAAAYWHWFFFQVPDLPEMMLSAAPEQFLRSMFRALTANPGSIEEPMVQEYLRAFTLPGTIRAGLEDSRGGNRDIATTNANWEIACPVLAIGASSARCTPCSMCSAPGGKSRHCARPPGKVRPFHSRRSAGGVVARPYPLPFGSCLGTCFAGAGLSIRPNNCPVRFAGGELEAPVLDHCCFSLPFLCRVGGRTGRDLYQSHAGPGHARPGQPCAAPAPGRRSRDEQRRPALGQGLQRQAELR
jgi:haloacetate dehalogenase